MQSILLRNHTDDFDWGKIIDLEEFPKKSHNRVLS